jgi:hypothetical protein
LNGLHTWQDSYLLSEIGIGRARLKRPYLDDHLIEQSVLPIPRVIAVSCGMAANGKTHTSSGDQPDAMPGAFA